MSMCGLVLLGLALWCSGRVLGLLVPVVRFQRWLAESDLAGQHREVIRLCFRRSGGRVGRPSGHRDLLGWSRHSSRVLLAC